MSENKPRYNQNRRLKQAKMQRNTSISKTSKPFTRVLQIVFNLWYNFFNTIYIKNASMAT